jgi:hypothetical protein
VLSIANSWYRCFPGTRKAPISRMPKFDRKTIAPPNLKFSLKLPTHQPIFVKQI